jgi:hypothetical protein
MIKEKLTDLLTIMRHSSQNKPKGHPKTIRCIYALIVTRKGIRKNRVGQREVDKKVKDPSSIKIRSPKEERKRKAHAAKEGKSSDSEDNDIALQILKQFLLRKLAQGLLIFSIQELVPI